MNEPVNEPGKQSVISGSCLCGEVCYEIAGQLRSVTHCHCSMCRKAHGAAFATYAEVEARDLRFTRGQDLIVRYRSSQEAQRSFCSRCGSNLLFEPEESPNLVWVAVGGLDSDSQVRPGAHIFVGSKAPWLDIDDDLPQHPADSD
jgi:hypothetical protein